MNFVKKNFKLILGIIIGAVLISGISVYATSTYLASQVTYKESKTVEEALNELYAKGSTVTLDSANVTGGSISYTFNDDYKAAFVVIVDGDCRGSTWSTTCGTSTEISSNKYPNDVAQIRIIHLANIKEGDTLSASHTEDNWGIKIHMMLVKD